jgi:hypothetical protein
MPTINHNDVNRFSSLTSGQISAAAALTVMFRHASVGANIVDGMWAIYNSDNRFSFTGWSEYNRGNPGSAAKLADFTAECATQHDARHVLMFKFCWVDPDFVVDDYIACLEAAEAAYPANKVIWWTMPLVINTTIDTDNAIRRTKNEAIRTYCAANGKLLFDLAAIESHEPDGTPHLDGSTEALYDAYSDDGGHLDTDGSLRVAQAMWVALSDLATPTSLNFHMRSTAQTVGGTTYGVRRYHIG